jgi:hypothetical protein
VKQMEDVPEPGTIDAVQSQLSAIQRQLGKLDGIESTLRDIYSALSSIRTLLEDRLEPTTSADASDVSVP